MICSMCGSGDIESTVRYRAGDPTRWRVTRCRNCGSGEATALVSGIPTRLVREAGGERSVWQAGRRVAVHQEHE